MKELTLEEVKIYVLEHFCKYLAENRDIWCTTCKNIADYYRAELEGEKHE